MGQGIRRSPLGPPKSSNSIRPIRVANELFIKRVRGNRTDRYPDRLRETQNQNNTEQ